VRLTATSYFDTVQLIPCYNLSIPRWSLVHFNLPQYQEDIMPPKRNIAETETEEPVDWNTSTVPQLKAELGLRQLPKTGRKADLVARLQAHDAGTLVTEPAGPDVADAPVDPEPSSSAPAPKKKRAKKEKSPDVEIEGELAKDVVTYQNYNPQTGEQRPRPFVGVPDDKFKDKVKKIRKERMFMIDRQRTQDRDGYPSERFDIAGSTGNIYQAEIGRNPKCTCMDAVSANNIFGFIISANGP
jgi:hypothetical protein